jgi:hypothetical protein
VGWAVRFRLLAVFASLLLFANKGKSEAPVQAKEVRVYDREHQLIASITDTQQLEILYRLWLDRDPLPWDRAKNIDFPYSIAGLAGGMMLYRADGIATKLDHLTHRRYQVRNVAELNRMLGILP